MMSGNGGRRWLAARMMAIGTMAVALDAGPAAAEAYKARTIAGWMISPSSDGNGCFLTRQFDGEGNTTLLLGLDIDGSNRLSVLNDNWSIKPREALKLDFRLTNGGYSDQAAIGIASGGQRGFVTNFEAKFPTYFGSSKALHIYRGKVPVEQLDLAGSGSAITELRRCVDQQRADAKARPAHRARSGRIPKDPFATDLDRKAKR
jgi:hypothetical protein